MNLNKLKIQDKGKAVYQKKASERWSYIENSIKGQRISEFIKWGIILSSIWCKLLISNIQYIWLKASYHLQAANYLDIKGLLDVTCKTVANMIKGKTPEEIRKTFNIKNDFTEEEEAQVGSTQPVFDYFLKRNWNAIPRQEKKDHHKVLG